MRIHEVGEFGLIERLAARLKGTDREPSVVVGIGDDAAVTAYTPGMQVVTTTDLLVEGVHFRGDTIGDRALGWKCLAVSISDIAAMGGVPRHAVVSLAVPNETEVERLEELYEGINEICEAYGTHVIGGDITKTVGPLVISGTVFGEVEAGRALLRSGARAGDLIFVTGTVGGSAAGLEFVQEDEVGKAAVAAEDASELLRFHQVPQPQVRAGRILVESGAGTSANDVSDGLASELNEIAKMSRVRLVVDGEKVPIHESVSAYAKKKSVDSLEWALFGGEDYQLVGTVKKEHADEVTELFSKEGLAITYIGHVEEGEGVVLRRGEVTVELLPKGFNHFGE